MPRPKSTEPCKVTGCDNEHKAKGFCHSCYMKHKRGTLGVKTKDVICVVCKLPYQVPLNQAGPRKYCSEACKKIGTKKVRAENPKAVADNRERAKIYARRRKLGVNPNDKFDKEKAYNIKRVTGYTIKEVAQLFNVSERTISRAIEECRPETMGRIGICSFCVLKSKELKHVDSCGRRIRLCPKCLSRNLKYSWIKEIEDANAA